MIRFTGKKLFQYVGLLPGIETVLDVGAGPGLHSKKFADRGKKVTGLDIRKQTYITTTIEDYEYIQESAETFDPEGRTWDLVWSSHVLEHVPNPGLMLKTMIKCVKPGGYLAIVVPPDPQGQIHVGHLTYWTPYVLMAFLVNAGVDLKDARWYTDFRTIDLGLVVQINQLIDVNPTYTLHDTDELQKGFPVRIVNRTSAWIGDRWEPNEYLSAEQGAVTSPV